MRPWSLPLLNHQSRSIWREFMQTSFTILDQNFQPRSNFQTRCTAGNNRISLSVKLSINTKRGWIFPLQNPVDQQKTLTWLPCFFSSTQLTWPTLTPHWRSSEQHRWTIFGMADLRLFDTLIANGANGANGAKVREPSSTFWAEMEDKRYIKNHETVSES